MRGINTNNYAESGIRILKDIVFKRVKAYNLMQLFNFKLLLLRCITKEDYWLLHTIEWIDVLH